MNFIESFAYIVLWLMLLWGLLNAAVLALFFVTLFVNRERGRDDEKA